MSKVKRQLSGVNPNGDNGSVRENKLAIAATGGLVTLMLTVTVASLQYVFFFAPAVHINTMRAFHSEQVNMDEDFATNTRLQALFDKLTVRSDARKLILDKADGLSLPASATRNEVLGAYFDTLQDYETVMGIQGSALAEHSPGRALLHALEVERDEWVFILDKSSASSAESRWRNRIRVVSAMKGVGESYHSWIDDRFRENRKRELEISAISGDMHVSEVKLTGAFLFLLAEYILLRFYWVRLAAFFRSF